VFNDTRVLKARFFGVKQSGGKVEVLIERVLDNRTVHAQVRASKSPPAGSRIRLADAFEVEVGARSGEFYALEFPGDVLELIEAHGRLPLPPYIEHSADAVDEARYQTVYAKTPGAVAAPTAGLHFDEPLLAALKDKGVDFGHVTLHVGAGTFQPVRADDLKDHVMHREWLNVGAELVQQVRRTRAAGGRVIGVGTTVVRALESAMRDGELLPFAGETQIFITPGYRIRSVDAMVTNFHLPESTLLMMISAFAGKERVFEAYQHAIEQRYRFFSYGDAMLLFPQAG
jgi:S-adenosylmethionine:tRNA ribosyltransferase-isomerase